MICLYRDACSVTKLLIGLTLRNPLLFCKSYSRGKGFKEICETVFIVTIIPLVITWDQAPWLGKGANRTEHKKSAREESQAGY